LNKVKLNITLDPDVKRRVQERLKNDRPKKSASTLIEELLLAWLLDSARQLPRTDEHSNH